MRYAKNPAIGGFLLVAAMASHAGAQGRTIRVVSPDGEATAYANVIIDGGETKITDEQGLVRLAIEVYNRGGNMPISLQANDNICGVIAFWTGSRKQ